MRDNLELKKFDTETVNGTLNILEEPTFFNSKSMDIEDNIIIDDKSIQYYQISTDNDFGIGYQYYELSTYNESFTLLDLINLKYINHNIELLKQSEVDEKFNTKWKLNINVRDILREYLFANIKKARTFKSLKSNNFINKDINESIYDYINLNLLDRYEFKTINLYIKYYDITENSQLISNLLKQYDPQYKSELQSTSNLVGNTNIEQNNIIDSLADVKLNYSQTKPSTKYKFDYYFEVLYQKI